MENPLKEAVMVISHKSIWLLLLLINKINKYL